MSDTLPAEEIQRLTGYKRPADQLRELHRQGFWRARLSRVGKRYVVLERPHHEAVMAGVAQVQPRPPVDISNIKPSRRGSARPIDWDVPTALYHHFDKNGSLLYIGIAADPKKRESTHRCYSEWRDKIHRIEVEWFPIRHAAVAAERAAIAAERPKFNILHQREPSPC